MLRGGHSGEETGSLDLTGMDGAEDVRTMVLEVCSLI